jgi:hypothetical protein
MKKTNTLLVAAILALSVGKASATIDYVSGSTAFRKAANAAISTWVEGKGSVGTLSGIVYADQNASSGAQGATDIVWSYADSNNPTTGTGATGKSYLVAHWNGSEKGIQVTASTATESFIDVLGGGSVLLYSTPTSFATYGANAPATKTSVTASHQIAKSGTVTFADTKQNSSYFKGTYAGVTYATLTQVGGNIGVVPFVFVTSSAAPARVTNITGDAFRQLAAAGYLSGNVLSGNLSDANDGFWLVGRDIDSGTRETVLGVTGYGVTKGVQQYRATSATAIALEAQTTINGILELEGNGGWSSGSSSSGLVKNLIDFSALSAASLQVSAGGVATASQFTTGNWLLGYAGTGDTGKSALAGGGAITASTGQQSDASGCNAALRILSYNGVPYSDTAVKQGQYPIWGYEVAYYNSATATANTSAFLTGLTTTIKATVTGTSSSTGLYLAGIQASTMNCSRSVDFGVISNNY